MAELPKSTVLRLERRITLDNARALGELHERYSELAAAVLAAAQARGHLGSDPLGAVADLSTMPPAAAALGHGVLGLWRTFFACFRPDEAAFEAARFQAEAEQLEQRLAGLPAEAAPEPELAAELVAALQGFWQARHQAIDERLDLLIRDLTTQQAKMGSVELARAHGSDEIARASAAVRLALAEAGLMAAPAADKPAAEQPLAQEITRLLVHYRAELAEHRSRGQEIVAAFGAFVAAVRSAAKDAPGPSLPPEAEAVVAEVRRLEAARRAMALEADNVRTALAQAEAERRELMEELADRDARLGRIERPAAGDEVDKRLALYRQAFAELEAGHDYRLTLEKVRTIERVVSLPAAEGEALMRMLDRTLSDMARSLDDLRKISTLADDPKRFRPRGSLFGFGPSSSRYELKRVEGLVAALRDAGRDLLIYVERQRWALGVGALARQVPKLRAVFKELVGLVAMWRAKLGDAPPVSLTVRMDAGSGILALPAIVGADLAGILRRKAKAGPAATDLAPIIEECVALFHHALVEARGTAAPRVPKPKRESSIQAVARLAAELTALAAATETAFAEAARSDFRLDPSDRALLDDEHLSRLALGQLDAACLELAGRPDVPPQEFPALPGKRDFDGLLNAARARVEWLELLASYRFQTVADRE
jgi:hypothetical protein